MQMALVMFKMDGKRQEFTLAKQRTVVGRRDKCDLRIPLSSVSREHCEITIQDDVATLRDLGSTNGTLLNDDRIQKQNLKAGDEITIGPVVFTVVIDGQPADIQPIQMVLDGRRSSPNLEPKLCHAMGLDERPLSRAQEMSSETPQS